MIKNISFCRIMVFVERYNYAEQIKIQKLHSFSLALIYVKWSLSRVHPFEINTNPRVQSLIYLFVI